MVALDAVNVPVLVRVWPSNDLGVAAGSMTCTWTEPVVPAARPVLAGVVLGTASCNWTFTRLPVTLAVTLPAPTTLGCPTTTSGAGTGSVMVASTHPVVVDEHPKLSV